MKAFSEAVGEGRTSTEPPIRMNLDIGTMVNGSIAQAAEARKDMLAVMRESNAAITAAQQARIDAMEALQIKLMERGDGTGPSALTAQLEGWRAVSQMFREMAEEVVSKQAPALVGDASVQVMLKKLDVDLTMRQSELSMKLEEMKDARLEREKQFEFEKQKWHQEREDAKKNHDEEMAFKRQQAQAEAAQKERQGETFGVIVKALGATIDETMMGGTGETGAMEEEVTAPAAAAQQRQEVREVTSEKVMLPCKHEQVVRSDATMVKCATCQTEYAASAG